MLERGHERMPERGRGLGWIIVLSLVTSIGPLASDTYLAGLPELTEQFGATDAQGQLTISACILGLAIGQLVFGPLSDRMGRRRLMLSGLAVSAVLMFVCIWSPTISVLIALRFAQGFAASSGVALARAMVRDVYGEERSAKVFAQLMTIAVVVPVLAPILGGALLIITDWRGVFIAVGTMNVIILLVAVARLPETLAPDRRHGAGSGQLLAIGRLLRDARFLSYVGAIASGSVIMFGFITMSVLAYQRDFDIDPQQFAVVFGVNTAAIAVVSQINMQLMRWFAPRRILAGGVGVAAIAGATGLIGAIAGHGFWWVLVCTLITVSSLGVISPNASALAIGPHAADAGTASAIVGLVQFGTGAVVSPIVTALFGASAVTLTAMLFVAACCCLLFIGLAGVPAARVRRIHAEVR